VAWGKRGFSLIKAGQGGLAQRRFTPSPPETGDGVAWGQRVGVRGMLTTGNVVDMKPSIEKRSAFVVIQVADS
jgi:hypothetical protein